MQSSNPYDSYLQTQVFAASPLELTVMVYRAAADALKSAIHFTDCGDIRARGDAASRATAMVLELVNSLDDERGGEIAMNLRRLYDYVLSRIHDGHGAADARGFQEAVAVLEVLLDSWQSIAAAPETPSAKYVHEPIECSF